MADLKRYDGSVAGNPLVILGIPIPTGNPLFLAVLAIHIPAGLCCVVAGLAAMLLHKGPGRHPTAGTIYYWSLLIVFVTTALLAAMRWAEDSHLFVLGTLSFLFATLGRAAMRHRWCSYVKLHLLGMGFSYVVLLIAFYIDNGPNLPGWRSLPHAAYWFIPLVVGMPIILYAYLRHPLAQSGFRYTGAKH